MLLIEYVLHHLSKTLALSSGEGVSTCGSSNGAGERSLGWVSVPDRQGKGGDIYVPQK